MVIANVKKVLNSRLIIYFVLVKKIVGIDMYHFSIASIGPSLQIIY